MPRWTSLIALCLLAATGGAALACAEPAPAFEVQVAPASESEVTGDAEEALAVRTASTGDAPIAHGATAQPAARPSAPKVPPKRPPRV